MKPMGAILDHFHKLFFHLLKSKNFWRPYDIDKDITTRNCKLLIILLIHLLVPLADKTHVFSQRYEIYSLSIEQKSLLYLKSDWLSMQTFSCSRHEPRECSQSFAVTLNVDFIK